MLIDDYLKYQETYQKKYGEKTIILMQVGSFFEAYAIDGEDEKINVENLYYICDLMNIQISRKNKNIIKSSRSNPLMAGFPLLAIDKFIQILMNNNFTVVLIEQVTEPPEPKREITGIYSPGTQINYCPSEDTSNLVSVFIDTYKDVKTYQDKVSVGLSVIDLPTGKSIIYESYSEKDDTNKAFDEIYRFIYSHNPKEIIFNIKSCPLDNKKLVTYLEIQNKIYHFINLDQLDKDVFKLSYQRTFLEKVYAHQKKNMLTIHEYLDLEHKPNGVISFIFLLQFAYEHNEQVIERLDKPEIWEGNNYLILTNDSISQLNLVDNSSNNINNKYNSLLGIVSNASTAIGKRYLKEQVLNPINSVEKLNHRYQCIGEMLERDIEGEYRYKLVEEKLKKIMDIERLHRRMSLKILQPADFSNLDMAYQNIIQIFNLTNLFEKDSNLSQILPCSEEKDMFNQFIDEYRDLFDLEEISKYHLGAITGSFFNKGKVEEIDIVQNKIYKYQNRLQNIANKLSYYIEKGSQFVKVEFIEKEGHYLLTTKKRGESLKKAFSNMAYQSFNVKDGEENIKVNPRDLELKFLKDRTKITSEKINTISYKLRSLQDKLEKLTTQKYLEKLEYFYQTYHQCLQSVCIFIAKIDFYKSNAKSAIMYGYTKPIIEKCENSFVNIKEMRHPIIERISTQTEYVPNDIKLGNNGLNGMLLYGCNAVGKSSLMKAVGLNIIMAQAGMFVAASNFIYQPFDYIFTRISDNDNIFKGQSSFAVEMSELRSILKRSNNRSMVLGDELCSGTESVSAQSIFAASVIKLGQSNINFIFATHLHELNKMTQVSELENVKSFHLKVIFDEKTKTLTYDRKLEEGSGPTIYGLEVCKAMDLDEDFLKLANKLRQEIIDQDEKILSNKKSNYNHNLFMDKCKVCGLDAIDTHHIVEQQEFDSNNMKNNICKNNLSNLVPLCECCHNKVHHGNLVIKGYIDTNEGVKLDFFFQEKLEEKKNNKKYDAKQIQKIIKLRDIPNMSMAKACRKLDSEYNIKISNQTLKKIWLEQY